jgi:hypothetical protein
MQISGKHLRLLAIIVLASLMIVNVPASSKVSATPVIKRISPIPINVVLLGFDASQINPNYLVWNGTLKNLPSEVQNVVSDGFNSNSTGVIFKPEYKVSFAPDSFKQDLLTYLTSIERQARGPDPWFLYYSKDLVNPDYYVGTPVSINYVTYDANSVEEWLWSHLPSLGVRTDNGWTIIVDYLPQLPSINFYDAQQFLKNSGGRTPPPPPTTKPHYYSIPVTDSDLGYMFPKRDFMKAWGGHHRMWFVDLSAGPVSLQSTNTAWDDLPLQVVVADNNIDLASNFGKNWLTEYVADYVFDATYSFVARDFVYYPRYSPEYQIDINILDDRTDMETSQVPILKTVNQYVIATAVKDLVPYSNVTVNLHIQNTTQALHALIGSEYKYTDSWIWGNTFSSPLRYGVVDLRPIYRYVLDNFNQFEPTISTGSPSRRTIPVFGFAFSGQTYFTYTSKWNIQKTDWDTGALLGLSFDEGVFISLNQYEFTLGQDSSPPQPGKGRGFSQTIIHELGHEFGLTHPHDYNSLGDFFYSPMGYFTNDYKFGISDKDSIQRAHVDGLYLQTEMILSSDPKGSSNSGLINQARSKLMQVDSDYAKLDYADAIRPVLAALQLAQEAAATGSMQNVTQTMTSQTTASGNYSIGAGTMIYIVAGIAVGLVLGFAISMVLKRRKL